MHYCEGSVDEGAARAEFFSLTMTLSVIAVMIIMMWYITDRWRDFFFAPFTHPAARLSCKFGYKQLHLETGGSRPFSQKHLRKMDACQQEGLNQGSTYEKRSYCRVYWGPNLFTWSVFIALSCANRKLALWYFFCIWGICRRIFSCWIGHKWFWASPGKPMQIAQSVLWCWQREHKSQ